MKSLKADINVMRHIVLALRALRASADFEIASAAIEREREMQQELERAEQTLEMQRKIGNVSEVSAIDHEDYPQAVGFSRVPTLTEGGTDHE